MRKLIVLLGLLGLLTGAEAAQSLVTGYFRDLQSLETDFVQSVFDADSQLIESSSGHMLMQKPGRFRWDYRQPYEQLIVADGDRIWHYDSDLEQVTVRRLDRALSATPLALLSGAAPWMMRSLSRKAVRIRICNGMCCVLAIRSLISECCGSPSTLIGI